MNKNRDSKLKETIGLFKKVAQDPNSVSNADKKQIKRLIGKDESLMIEALLSLQEEENAYLNSETEFSSLHNDECTHEEIIAENYISLAKFAINKLNLKNVHKLKVQESDCGFVIYALTPAPIELDFEQFATSDHPTNKGLLLEAEALQSDLFMEDSTEKYKAEIVRLIESAVL